MREEVADALNATLAERIADFLESLSREGVAYVVIGGIAVLAYIPYRTTRDLDVLIEPTLENAVKARRAVAAWGSFEPEYAPADFIAGDIHSRVQASNVWNGRVASELLGPTCSGSKRVAKITPEE